MSKSSKSSKTQENKSDELEPSDTEEIVVVESSPFDSQTSHTADSSSATSAPDDATLTKTGTDGVANASTTETKSTTNQIQDEKIQMVAIDLLKPNPRNVDIYGDEPVDVELQKSIVSNGIQEPLITTEEFKLMAGHRRAKAAKAAGITHVPVVIRKFDSETAELTTIVETNRQRIKTILMMGNEAEVIYGLESALAKARQTEGGQAKSDETASRSTKTKKGKTRDLVGEHLGLSGVSAQRLIETVRAARKLDEEQKPGEAKAVRDELNKSVNAGYKKAIETGAIKASKTAKPVKSVEKQPAPAQTAPKLETSPYKPDDGIPEIEDHKQAMRAMEVLARYVEDMVEPEITDGLKSEWQESMQILTEALKAAEIID